LFEGFASGGGERFPDDWSLAEDDDDVKRCRGDCRDDDDDDELNGYHHFSPSSDIRSFVAFVRASVPRAGGICSWEISSCMLQSTGKAVASRKDWNARDSEGVSNDIVYRGRGDAEQARAVVKKWK